jgi:hypothetical protein
MEFKDGVELRHMDRLYLLLYITVLPDFRSRRMKNGQLGSGCYPSKFSNIDPSYIMPSYDDLHRPYYDIYCSKPIPVTPHHFGLSKYGHLKIDYSFSWNSLDKYIATE